jgi:rubrerythrin
MNEKDFQEVIQFAIEREIESVDFYTKASRVVKFSGSKELFLDFAKEEQGHRKLLENIHMERVGQTRIETIPNLRISDYMVDAEFRPEMPYADILRMAMKREERSIQLYHDLKEPVQDEDLKKLFSFLVQEETKHKYRLEKVYDDEILK